MIDISYTTLASDFYAKKYIMNLKSFDPILFNRLNHYKRWQDVQASLLGRILLMRTLQNKGYQSNPLIEYNKWGKPFVKNESFNFSISHSHYLVICAVTEDGEIGIDIENVVRHEIHLYKNCFQKPEWDLIVQSDDPYKTFLMYWTQKEAVVKAIGKGLSISMDRFSIINGIVNDDGKLFYLKEVGIGDEYTCHIALEKKNDLYNMKVEKVNILGL